MNGVFNVLHAVFARVYIFWVLFLHCFNMLCLVFLTFVVVFVVVTSDTTDQSRASRDSSIFEDSPSNLLCVDTNSRRSTSKCTRTFWALLKCTRTITRYNIVVRGGRGVCWCAYLWCSVWDQRMYSNVGVSCAESRGSGYLPSLSESFAEDSVFFESGLRRTTPSFQPLTLTNMLLWPV